MRLAVASALQRLLLVGWPIALGICFRLKLPVQWDLTATTVATSLACLVVCLAPNRRDSVGRIMGIRERDDFWLAFRTTLGLVTLGLAAGWLAISLFCHFLGATQAESAALAGLLLVPFLAQFGIRIINVLNELRGTGHD